MLQAIIDNPYRILGVYANAGDNEVLEAASRLLSNPNTVCETDFNIVGLPKPRRDPAAINSAKQKVLDSNDSVLYKLFWFMKSSDNAGYVELMAGRIGNASNVWLHSSTFESKHNILVGYIIEGDFALAAFSAYELIFKQDYRTKILKTNGTYTTVINRFKDTLFDEVNAVYMPLGTNKTWKQYVRDYILKKLSDSINLYYIQKAKKQIDVDNPISYLAALSTMSSSWSHIYTLREFADTANLNYIRLSNDITSYIFIWIEMYLSKSQDDFKYRNVFSVANSFAHFSSDKIQESYLSLLGLCMQHASDLLMLPEICHLCTSSASKIFHYYLTRKCSSSDYIDIIKQTAPAFVGVKQALGKGDRCYQSLANFMAQVGLFIIGQELFKEIDEQKVGNCGTVIYYIDTVIDSQYLNEINKSNRDRHMNTLWNLGLSTSATTRFPHALGKMDIDPALYEDEDTTFHVYCSSLRGCQNYLKRFPSGKYVGAVKLIIAENRFKGNNHNTTIPKTNNDGGRVNPASYKPSNNTSTNVHQDNGYTIIGVPRLYKYIIAALLLEIICGIFLGNYPMLIFGLVLVFGYWLVTQTSGKRFDNSSRRVFYFYFFGQMIVSLSGLLILH